jgi:phasin family protein
MENDKAPDMSEMVAQSMEQARGAMENYLRFFQKSMSATPWAETDLNKKLTSYAEQNVATTFAFAQKLTQAKDLQEIVGLQTEFFQKQLKALTDQAKDINETATKAAVSAFKKPTNP